MLTNLRRYAVSALIIVLALGFVGIEPAFSQDGPTVKGKKRKAPPAAPKTTEKNDKGFAFGPDAMTHFILDVASKKNEVVFTSKAPKETIKGKAGAVKGEIDLNPRKLDAVTGSFAVEWKSIDTGNKGRNNHMLNKPWVDTGSHPEIIFTVTGMEMGKVADKKGKTIKAKLVGKLAMNGKEKDTKIAVTLVYIEPPAGSKTGKEGIGIKTTFKVALADFGIEGKPGAVGNAVAEQPSIKVSIFLKRAEASDSKDGGNKMSFVK